MTAWGTRVVGTMAINTDNMTQCIDSLEQGYALLEQHRPGGTSYDIYRVGCVRMLETIMSQVGSLLRKRLRSFFSPNLELDRLTFKDAFRHAAKHGLISSETCQRWLEYRNGRDDPIHENMGVYV